VYQSLSASRAPAVFATVNPERLLTGALPKPAHLINTQFRPNFVRALVSQALIFQQDAQRDPS